MRPFDYVCWLLTSSVLNLNSEYQEQFYEKAKSVLKEDAARNRLEWLNIVHAFLVVGHANQELLSSVLKPQFIEYIGKICFVYNNIFREVYILMDLLFI